MAISSRRKAVLSLAEEMGYSSAGARQAAALATRPAKDRAVEAGALRESWRAMLDNSESLKTLALAYSMRIPEMARLMTSCWICSVPSKMSWIFASRWKRSTGKSRM